MKKSYINKICLYGGTFNPIHLGHINMAKKAYRLFKFDKVIFIPTGNSYLKSDVLDANIRFLMVEEAISKIKYFDISDIENKRESASYTYETLQEFKKLYPDSRLYFLIGEDSLRYIEHWRNVQTIFELATVIVARRANSISYNDSNLLDFDQLCAYLETKYNCEILSFDFDIPISSSEIRNAYNSGDIKQIDNISSMLPISVKDYIENNNIYNFK